MTKALSDDETYDLDLGGSSGDVPAACLRDAVVSRLQDPERALVAHADETAEGQLENEALLERHEVAHVLEQEEAGPVVVAVAEVAGDQRVLGGTQR